MLSTYAERTIRRVKLHLATMGRPFQDADTGRRYKRIHHFHIRKTAGTSLNASFWRLCTDVTEKPHGRGRFIGRSDIRRWPPRLVFVRQDERMLEEGRYHIGYSHEPSWAFELPDDTFTLTIVRDPLRRLQSYYRYLVWVRRQHMQTPDALKKAEPGWRGILAEAEALGPVGSESLKNLVERAPAQHVVNQLWMFSKELDPVEGAEGIRGCSAILRTESYEKDLARLSEQLNLPLRAFRERGYDYSEIPAPTPADLSVAREALAAEYEMFERLGLDEPYR